MEKIIIVYHTIDNVKIISFRANSLKKDATLDEIELVAKYMREKYMREKYMREKYMRENGEK